MMTSLDAVVTALLSQFPAVPQASDSEPSHMERVPKAHLMLLSLSMLVPSVASISITPEASKYSTSVLLAVAVAPKTVKIIALVELA